MKIILDQYRKYRDSVNKVKALEDKVSRLNEELAIHERHRKWRRGQTDLLYKELMEREQNFNKLKRLEVDISIN